jgi:hypothetical protein
MRQALMRQPTFYLCHGGRISVHGRGPQMGTVLVSSFRFED